MKKVARPSTKLKKNGFQKRKKCEDTIVDDENENQQAVKKNSKEEKPRSKPKSKENQRTSKEKKKMSAEVTEKEKEPEGLKIARAAKAFCKYLLDMKESSLSTYFDEHLARYQPTDQTTTEWEKNMPKNRSKEAKLYDKSRVVLKCQTPEDSEYINASVIKFDGSDSEFIMTQYPLWETVRDCWRMISQKKALRVITIFEPFVDEAIEEWNKVPSVMTSPATPLSAAEQSADDTKIQTRDQIVNNSVRCESTQIKSFFPLYSDHYMNLNGWLINTQRIEVDERDKTWVNTYSIEIVADGCSEANYVRVFNCTTWQWKKIPSEEKKLLALVRAPYKDIHPNTQPNDPIVVMCDLGLDRSATVVLTAILIELILAGKAPDCDALFKKMRDQRAGCFTMSMYYTYAIRATLIYLRIKFRQMSDIPEDVKQMITDALYKVPCVKK